MTAMIKTACDVGLLAAGVLAAAPAGAQQFTMKLSQPTINDVTYEYFKPMKAGIEQRSGGKIKVEIYPSNQLGQLPAVVEGVALGTIEAAASANGFWVSLEPRFQVLDAPGLFDDLIARQQDAERSRTSAPAWRPGASTRAWRFSRPASTAR